MTIKNAIYKQIGEREEIYTIIVPAEYDEDGNILKEAHEDTLTRMVPIKGTVYEEMTQKEILSLKNKVSDKFKPTLPTDEERLEALESALLDIILGGAL